MDLVQNYLKVRESVPENVKLVAVSKFKPESLISQLFEQTGHTEFGENRALEMTTKQSMLPSALNWHFIGHLQTNKVKFIVPYVHLVHSVDSFKLLKEVNKEAERCNRFLPVLLQFHIASEESKFGLSIAEAHEMFCCEEFKALQSVSICGVMGMASFTDDNVLVRNEFIKLRNYFDELKRTYYKSNNAFKEISMGMSGDYRIAIDEGSTIVRIGSLIFGGR